MTTTPPSFEPPDGPPTGEPTGGATGTHSGPRVSADDVRDLGRLRRSRDNRKIAGVAGGLGRHLDVDPVILRVAFVVLVFFGGAGLLLYGAMWLLVPEDGEAEAKIHLDPRNRTAALVIAGVLAACALVGDSVGGFGFPWPVIIIGGLVVLVLAKRDTRERREYAAQTHTATEYGAGAAYGTDPTSPLPAYAADPAYAAAPPPRRLSRREKYGPSLFLPTLALIAVSLGALRIFELAGASVVGAAYPALALAICGAALVFGAWVGRAGAVIWLAILSGIGMGVANVSGDIGTTRETPLYSSWVDPTYEMGIGAFVLDLTQVHDLAALDGKTISIDGHIGQLRVKVPAGMDVTAVGDISGGGRIELFGQADDGDNPHLEVNHLSSQRGDHPAHVTINADLDFGNIYVTEATR